MKKQTKKQQDVLNKTKKLYSQIEELHATKRKYQDDIQDLSLKLQLNRKTIRIILGALSSKISQQPTTSINELITKNESLVTEITKQLKSSSVLHAELLIQEQVTQEQKEYFESRIALLQEEIDEKRKLMHDKEYNFTTVFQKLNQYEQLPELQSSPLELQQKIVKAVEEYKNTTLICKLSFEKHQMLERSKNLTNQLERYQRQIDQLVDLAKQEGSHAKFHDKISKEISQKQSQELQDKYKQQKHFKLETQHPTYNRIQRQLVKQLKKQNEAGKALTEEFKDSLLVGEQLKAMHKQELQRNKKLALQLQKSQHALQSINLNLNRYRDCKRVHLADYHDFMKEQEQYIRFESQIKLQQTNQ